MGEDLSAGAEREVKEETGIDAKFESLVAFRHMHDFRFGHGDIYNVCVLRALDPKQVGSSIHDDFELRIFCIYVSML